jgi:UDP-glucose 4-epimerase
VTVFRKASSFDENIIVNVGSGKGTSIIDLAKLIQKTGHGSSEIIFREKRMGEVERFVARIDKAKKLLKWEPKTELGDGITHLIESFQV